MSVPYGFELIGHIDVDAGLVAVGDPCYTTGTDASSAIGSWTEYLDLLSKVGMFRSRENKEHGQPYEHKGASLVVNTLHGDGTYPVYAEYDKNAFGKVRGIARIMIDFDPTFEEEDDEDYDESDE